jgi:hypothetical protein
MRKVKEANQLGGLYFRRKERKATRKNPLSLFFHALGLRAGSLCEGKALLPTAQES